ncbi:MAG: ABC transporter permease [Rhodothermales bacterium]
MSDSSRPPRLAIWLLSHFRPRGDLDLLLGDLEEEFHDIQLASGLREARRWFWRQTFRSLPGLSFDFVDWKLRMLKTYLLIALRHLKRHTGYSAINIVGLAVGLAACLLIGLFVVQKLAYDRFHPDADHIYRITYTGSDDRTIVRPFIGTAFSIETHLPSAAIVTEVGISSSNGVFINEETPLYARYISADSNFFAVFDGFRMRRGNADDALSIPGQMIVTERFAKRHFANQDPIGSVLNHEGTTPYTIAGIVATPPPTSHFDFDVILSLSSTERSRRATPIFWNRFHRPVYVKVHPGATATDLEAQWAAFEASADKPPYQADASFGFQPLTDIHLHSAYIARDVAPQSDIRYLYLFGTVGLLILLMASINYINLSTARAVERSREVGVRKAIGARRGQLIQQFLSESALVVVMAMILAVPLVYLATPWINQMTGERLSLAFGTSTGAVLLIVGLVGLVVSVGAGSYPALYLSRFQPIRVLKGRAATAQRSLLRQGLVVFQFVMSMLLFIGALIVYQQLRYIQDRDLGFDYDQVVTLNGWALGTQYTAFKANLLESPSIIGTSTGSPLGFQYSSYTMEMDRENPGRQRLSGIGIDADYLDVMQPKLIAGRWFSEDRPSDRTDAIVLTESTVHALALEGDPIGQGAWLPYHGTLTIIGVVADIHNASLHQSVQPIAFFPQERSPDTDGVSRILVRLRAGELATGLAHLEAVWTRFVPERPIDVQFISDRIARQYEQEKRLANVFSLFAGLAVLIACLGVFGLAAFLIQQRTQEIAIRKVLGASPPGLVAMLTREYVGLIALGFVTAVPLVIWGAQQWFQRFAYHADLSPPVFIAAFFLVGSLALTAVTSQAWRASRINPAEAIRHE